ncbi:MAG: tetratricopeptide repeat protein, partial [Pseudomonadota bacterium]|nr:tetratricopeptide repeat protein [Pseudomonadota bacterium]
AQKKWPESAAAFQKGLSRQPVPALAARTYVSLQAADKLADATTLANQWMRDHPQDPTIPLLLAEQSQQKKDVAAAKSGYARVLEIAPDNAVALNNLAWLLTEEKNPKGLEYAEHAQRLAPFNPGILDTLGWALTHNGQAKRGVQILRMASSLAPAQGDIRLHLAQALASAGDKDGARKELTELTKLDKASPIRVEAEKLLATL